MLLMLLRAESLRESSMRVDVLTDGGTGTADGQMWMSDMRNLAEAENFIVIYPQGSQLEDGDTHWNPLMSSELNKSDTDDFAFVSAMLDQQSVARRRPGADLCGSKRGVAPLQ